MPKPATHILFEYPEAKAHSLYRATDGMHLAYQQENTVIFGHDPNPAKKEHRTFLDATFALMYLRRMADCDQSGMPLTAADAPVKFPLHKGKVQWEEIHSASIEERRPSVLVKPNLELGNKFAN